MAKYEVCAFQVRLLLAFVDCLENNLNLLPGLRVPFLSLHGTTDGLCNVEVSLSPLSAKLVFWNN